MWVEERLGIDGHRQLPIFQYVLESFTEARSTSEATEAIAPGQLFDHATSSVTDPWDYEVTPSRMFVDQVSRTPPILKQFTSK